MALTNHSNWCRPCPIRDNSLIRKESSLMICLFLMPSSHCTHSQSQSLLWMEAVWDVVHFLNTATIEHHKVVRGQYLVSFSLSLSLSVCILTKGWNMVCLLLPAWQLVLWFLESRHRMFCSIRLCLFLLSVQEMKASGECGQGELI